MKKSVKVVMKGNVVAGDVAPILTGAFTANSDRVETAGRQTMPVFGKPDAEKSARGREATATSNKN